MKQFQGKPPSNLSLFLYIMILLADKINLFFIKRKDCINVQENQQSGWDIMETNTHTLLSYLNQLLG